MILTLGERCIIHEPSHTTDQRVSCLLAGCCDSINRIFHRLDSTFLGKLEKAHLWCRKIPFGYLKVSQKGDLNCRFIECIFSSQARAFIAFTNSIA